MENNDYNAQIKPYLIQGENVIMYTRPKKRFMYLPSDLFSILRGILWLAVAGFWLAFSVINFQDTKNAFFIIISIPFILTGIWLIVGRNILLAIQRRHIIYTITNKRVLIINTDKEFCEEFNYSDIGSLSIKKYKDNTGSIFFYKDKNEQGKNKLSTSGIFGICEVEKALDILKTKVRNYK